MLGCLCGESELGGMPLAEAWGVGGAGDELRAREVEVAFTRSLRGKPEAVPGLELGLEEIGFEPLDRDDYFSVSS